MLKAKIKLIEDGKAPVKGSEKASCYDLFAREILVGSDSIVVSLGIAIQPPPGYDVRLYPRGSLAKTGWVLANSIGIGDEDFTGEYKAVFRRLETRHSSEMAIPPYKVGDRCLQMEIVKKDQVGFEIVDELSETERGHGGFGSTGSR